MARFFALAGLVYIFVCLPFFAVGDVFLDPSGEYSNDRATVVTLLQWGALVAPPLLLWAIGRTIISKDAG